MLRSRQSFLLRACLYFFAQCVSISYPAWLGPLRILRHAKMRGGASVCICLQQHSTGKSGKHLIKSWKIHMFLPSWNFGGWQGLDSKEFPPPPCLNKPEILPLPKSRLYRSMSWNSVVILHQKLNIEQHSRIIAQTSQSKRVL